MMKLVAGFCLGVLVTLATIYLRDRNSSDNREIAAELVEIPEQPADNRQEMLSAPIADSTERSGDLRNIESLTDAIAAPEVLAPQTGLNGVPQPTTQQSSNAARSSTQPIRGDIPPEIADMLENIVDKDLQARYESDQREESWATYMEGQLNAYFAQKPELAQFYFSLTDCRTSVCEIHALGYGPDALTQWNSATADLVSQPWFEFNSMSMNRRNPEPDILGIVLILTKKPN